MDAIRGILTSFGIESTAFVTLGLMFLATYAITRFLVFKKASYVVAERDERTSGREEAAEHLKAELVEISDKVKQGIVAARVEANTKFTAFQLKAAEEQRKIIGQARDQSLEQMKLARADVGKQVQGEIAKIQNEIPVLARKIVDQLLGTSGRN